MRRSLFWTLLGINLLVVGVAVGLAALMIGRLADAIFASLMKEFHIQADVPHHLFVTALWRSLLLASLAAGGVGVALSVCASTGVPDAATKTSDEADSRRLRLWRMDRAWFTEKVPDGDNYMLDCGAKHCDPWDERKLWPVTPARFARGAKRPKPRCQEIGGPRD